MGPPRPRRLVSRASTRPGGEHKGPRDLVPRSAQAVGHNGAAMLNRFARAFFTRILTPTAGFLVRRGISPDVVTLVGTLGVVVGALAFYPRHEFFWGTVVITC